MVGSIGIAKSKSNVQPNVKIWKSDAQLKLCLRDPMILYRACWALANGGTPGLSALNIWGISPCFTRLPVSMWVKSVASLCHFLLITSVMLLPVLLNDDAARGSAATF